MAEGLLAAAVVVAAAVVFVPAAVEVVEKKGKKIAWTHGDQHTQSWHFASISGLQAQTHAAETIG